MIGTLENKYGSHEKMLIFGTTALCPLNNQIDYYDVKVQYAPNDFIIEDLSFKDFLKDGFEEPMFMEEFGKMLYDLIKELIEPRYLCVILRDKTGPLERECVFD